MAPKWVDVSTLSFNSLLLLERVQLSWFPGWLPEPELAVALRANTIVHWYFRHKCPELNEWLDRVMAQETGSAGAETVRQAELTVMNAINDLLVYVVDPTIYDAQSFLTWDTKELTVLVDFTGKTVIDVGAGTGRLALAAAELAAAVFAVEPVSNMRHYLKQKAREQGVTNLYPVDGLITEIPFPDDFADVTMGGHVFGDLPEAEFQELTRVTKTGGRLILCPGNIDRDNERHRFLIAQGFQWCRFEEPGDGFVRKYWTTVNK